MNTSFRITKLSKSDKAQFVALISRAFSREPLFLHLFGDPEHSLMARRKAIAFVSFMFENEDLLGAYVVELPNTHMLQRIG
ncbi:hypothetical protein D3C74_21600 [compost metagenome]